MYFLLEVIVPLIIIGICAYFFGHVVALILAVGFMAGLLWGKFLQWTQLPDPR